MCNYARENNLFCVRVINASSLGTGYGCYHGKTEAEAIEKAMNAKKHLTPYYDERFHAVMINQQVYC